MSQSRTGRSISPQTPRRRWPMVAGAGVGVIAVFAVAYTALSPAPARTPGPPTTAGAVEGQPSVATALTATTLSGQKVIVPGGNPSVVFFFSVNCGSCGPGAQALARAQKVNPSANFVAVDVDPSESTTDVRKFLTANQAGGLAYLLDTHGSHARAYQLTALSTAVVLDAAGTEVFRGVDPSPDQIRAALTKAGAQ